MLDSSAAKAMVQRAGVGKVKHLDVRSLWLQAERRDHGLATKKVPGENALAALGTKAHHVPRLLQPGVIGGITHCYTIAHRHEWRAVVQARGS